MIKKWDASLVCFILVVLAAVPVAALRAKTFSIGYELGQLKNKERELRQSNIELQTELASAQRTVREKWIPHQSKRAQILSLPEPTQVIRSDSSR